MLGLLELSGKFSSFLFGGCNWQAPTHRGTCANGTSALWRASTACVRDVAQIDESGQRLNTAVVALAIADDELDRIRRRASDQDLNSHCEPGRRARGNR